MEGLSDTLQSLESFGGGGTTMDPTSHYGLAGMYQDQRLHSTSTDYIFPGSTHQQAPSALQQASNPAFITLYPNSGPSSRTSTDSANGHCDTHPGNTNRHLTGQNTGLLDTSAKNFGAKNQILSEDKVTSTNHVTSVKKGNWA